jgi:hypothetical protein
MRACPAGWNKTRAIRLRGALAEQNPQKQDGARFSMGLAPAAGAWERNTGCINTNSSFTAIIANQNWYYVKIGAQCARTFFAVSNEP